jgi:ubiquinone/menaquinone biosynthesis C-methylase UbiE
MTSSYHAISFNTVAPRYNQINALPEAAAATLGEALAALVPPGAPALDMGCGAGRVAIPAAAAGLPVVGVDLEGAMLREALTSATALPFTAARGTITRLPFAGASFNAVLSINVLHLVPEWRAVLDEAVRVLRPGGLFIQGRDWLDPDSCAGLLRSKLREVVMSLEPGLRPTAAASPAVLAAALSELGGVTEPELAAARWDAPISPAELLRQMAARAYNETWMLGDELLGAAMARLEAWAAETWSELEQAQPVERRFHLIVTSGLA